MMVSASPCEWRAGWRGGTDPETGGGGYDGGCVGGENRWMGKVGVSGEPLPVVDAEEGVSEYTRLTDDAPLAGSSVFCSESDVVSIERAR